MSIWPKDQPQLSLKILGTPSARQFTIQQNGTLFQQGDLGQSVVEVHVIENGREAFAKTAVELWSKMLEVNEELLCIPAPAPECALAGVVISRLVTGFEVYCKRRFYELHEEGALLHAIDLISEFGLNHRLEGKRKKASARDIRGFETGGLRKVSLGIEQKLINFQNYQHAARAYAAGYRIRFGDLPAIEPLVTTVTSCMKFRHRFTHAKPDTILFQESENGGKHVELSRALAREKQAGVDGFIRALHTATMSLKTG